MIADSLAVDESQVVPEARLIDDLGADSLDFVDLVFAIEKEFGVKVREADFNFLARLDFSSPEVMRDGFITREHHRLARAAAARISRGRRTAIASLRGSSSRISRSSRSA